MSDYVKICLVGGEDAHKRINLSKYLVNNKYQVTILGTVPYDYPKEINFIQYHLKRSFSPFSDIKTIYSYRRIFKKNRFDIIQTFDTKPAFLVPLACFDLKTKVVRTITGMGKFFTSNSKKNRIVQSVYIFLHFLVRKKVSLTTFQNSYDKEFFLEHHLVNSKNHCMIYGSGIELNNIDKVALREANPFTLICISRLIYEKGITYYLEAAEICHNMGYKFRFLLIGPLEENSHKLNEDILNKYKDHVTWLGRRNDIFDLLTASDAFVLPTFYREGFARVLLEASAVGLPLITTDVPGVTDIARHEKEALIVPIKNASELAKAIIKLGADENLRNKLSKNALSNVQQYSLEQISQNYLQHYQNI